MIDETLLIQIDKKLDLLILTVERNQHEQELIKSDVDLLKEWRWKMIGIGSAVLVLLQLIQPLLVNWAQRAP